MCISPGLVPVHHWPLNTVLIIRALLYGFLKIESTLILFTGSQTCIQPGLVRVHHWSYRFKYNFNFAITIVQIFNLSIIMLLTGT